MKTFDLYRDIDETGISGTGRVAQGVRFDDGSACLRWLSEHTSTAFYASMDDVKAIHGHNGKTRIVWTGDAFQRGFEVCWQDYCENVPFSSAGGLEARPELKAPHYIAPHEAATYLAGYARCAEMLYGKDWATCEFSWQPAIRIESQPAGASDASSHE